MAEEKKIPRGIRNNNPLNIRIGCKWKYEKPVNTDGVFEQFTQMRYGCRAAFLLLKRYIQTYHRNNVKEIISRWAPSNENNTELYIKRVCLYMKILPTTSIRFEDKDTMYSLFQAMAMVECGQKIDIDVVMRGYYMALNS